MTTRFYNREWQKTSLCKYISQHFPKDATRTAPLQITCPLAGLASRSPDFSHTAQIHAAVLDDIRNDRLTYGTSECTHDVAHPFVEMDIDETKTGGRPLTDEVILEFCLAAFGVFRRFFKNPITVVVLLCDPKVKDGIKTRGAHMVTQERVVFLDHLRHMVVSVQEVGMLGAGLDPSVVDTAVIKSSYATLRMPGAAKGIVCDVCLGDVDAKKDCDACGTLGKRMQLSRYFPCYIITNEGVRPCGREEYAFITPENRTPSEDFHVPNGMPPCPSRKRKSEAIATLISDDDRIPALMRSKNARTSDPPAEAALLKIIREYCPQQFANVRLDKLYRGNNKVSVFLRGEGSNWCCTSNREHQSNHALVTVVSRRNTSKNPIPSYMIIGCSDDVCKKVREENPNLGRVVLTSTVVDAIFGRQTIEPRTPRSDESEFLELTKRLGRKPSEP